LDAYHDGIIFEELDGFYFIPHYFQPAFCDKIEALLKSCRRSVVSSYLESLLSRKRKSY